MLSLFWKKSICRNRWEWQGATLDKLARRAAGNLVTCFYFHLSAFTTQQILRYGLHTHKFCMNRYLWERAQIRWYWCQCWDEWWICSNKNFSDVFRYLILFVFISHRFFGASVSPSVSVSQYFFQRTILISVVWWSLLLQCLIIPTCHIFDWVSVGNFCLHIYELLCWNIFERWEACHRGCITLNGKYYTWIDCCFILKDYLSFLSLWEIPWLDILTRPWHFATF